MKRLSFAGIRAVTLIITLMPANVSSQASFSGTIRGELQDANSRPIVKATIEAVPMGGPISGRVPTARSDDRGRFTLHVRAAGVYTLCAFKEEEFYPNSFWAIYGSADASSLEVTVESAAEVTVGRIVMRQTAGRVMGRVKNAVTGEPIREVNIELGRSGSDEAQFQTGASEAFEILVPSSGAWVRITSPGYAPWYYGDAQGGGALMEVRPEPGTTREIQVAMQPLSSARP